MRKIVFGTVILSALVGIAALPACDDKAAGGDAAPAASAVPASSASSAATAAPSASAKAEPEKKAEGPKDHKSRVKALEAAYASHDAKKVSALYTDDAVLKQAGRPDLKGHADIEKRAAKNFEVFKDIKTTAGRVWEKDKHTVVVEWVVAGTNNGDWAEMGIDKATNKPFGIVTASWYEVNDDGLIKEEHAFMDGPTVVGQLMPSKENPVRAIATTPPDGMDHFDDKSPKEDKTSKDDKKEEKKDEKKKDEKKAKEEPAVAGDVEKKDLEVEDKALAAFNGGKIDDGLKFYADDFKNVDYTQAKDQKGRKEFADLVHHFFAAFPDMKVKSTASFAVANFVVEEFEYTGTQKGALGPIKPTNKSVTLHQLEVDAFKDGKFVESWTWGNGTELMTELGVGPEKDKKEEKKEEKKKK